MSQKVCVGDIERYIALKKKINSLEHDQAKLEDFLKIPNLHLGAKDEDGRYTHKIDLPSIATQKIKNLIVNIFNQEIQNVQKELQDLIV